MSEIYNFTSCDGSRTISLKPCPFCGGEPDLKRVINNRRRKCGIEIICKECHVRRSDFVLRFLLSNAEELAVKAWNKRVGEVTR